MPERADHESAGDPRNGVTDFSRCPVDSFTSTVRSTSRGRSGRTCAASATRRCDWRRGMRSGPRGPPTDPRRSRSARVATGSRSRPGGRERSARWRPQPAFAGLDDDRGGFAPANRLLADLDRRRQGLRIGRSGAVLEALIPAILEQKVTGTEARRAYRGIIERWGEPAPGPFGLRLLPAPGRPRLAALPRVPSARPRAAPGGPRPRGLGACRAVRGDRDDAAPGRVRAAPGDARHRAMDGGRGRAPGARRSATP